MITRQQAYQVKRLSSVVVGISSALDKLTDPTLVVRYVRRLERAKSEFYEYIESLTEQDSKPAIDQAIHDHVVWPNQ